MTTPTPSSIAEAREIADKYMLRGGANWSLAIDAIALALDRRGACSSSIEDATNPVCDPDALDRRDEKASREMVLGKKYHANVHGTFFKCPMPMCPSVCRNGQPITQGHYVCEKCFTRFAKVSDDEVREVEAVSISPKELGAIEMMAQVGSIYMQQAYVDFHDAAWKLEKPYRDVYVPRFLNNHGQYKERVERSDRILAQSRGEVGG